MKKAMVLFMGIVLLTALSFNLVGCQEVIPSEKHMANQINQNYGNAGKMLGGQETTIPTPTK